MSIRNSENQNSDEDNTKMKNKPIPEFPQNVSGHLVGTLRSYNFSFR